MNNERDVKGHNFGAKQLPSLLLAFVTDGASLEWDDRHFLLLTKLPPISTGYKVGTAVKYRAPSFPEATQLLFCNRISV